MQIWRLFPFIWQHLCVNRSSGSITCSSRKCSILSFKYIRLQSIWGINIDHSHAHLISWVDHDLTSHPLTPPNQWPPPTQATTPWWFSRAQYNWQVLCLIVPAALQTHSCHLPILRFSSPLIQIPYFSSLFATRLGV